MRIFRKAVFLFLFISHAIVFADERENNWVWVAQRIEDELIEALDLHEKGDKEGAMEKIADAYFSIFEGERGNMEIAVRKSISLNKAVTLEKAFTDVRRTIYNNAPLREVKEKAMDLIKDLKGVAAELDKKGVPFEGFR